MNKQDRRALQLEPSSSKVQAPSPTLGGRRYGKMRLKSLSLLGAVATLSAGLAMAQSAEAQSYRYGYRGDCTDRIHSNGTTGLLLGGVAGALVGSNLAAHHGGRAGGAALGGLAGAALGSNIARSSTKDSCGGYYRPSYRSSYYQRPDDGQSNYGYDSYPSTYYAPRYPAYRGYPEPYGYARAPVVRTYVYSEPYYGDGYGGGYRHWDHDEGRHRGWGEHHHGHHDHDDDDDD
jgi:hypothetical protein